MAERRTDSFAWRCEDLRARMIPCLVWAVFAWCLPLACAQDGAENSSGVSQDVEYHYCGEKIREKQFEAMFEYAKDRFALHPETREIIDCRREKSNDVPFLTPNSPDGSVGKVAGKVIDVYGDIVVMLVSGPSDWYTVCVDFGHPGHGLAEGVTGWAMVVRSGVYQRTGSSSVYARFVQLQSINEDALWHFLEAGNKLYHLIKQGGGMVQCPTCAGKGTLAVRVESKYRLGGERVTQMCPDCHGRGKTQEPVTTRWTSKWLPTDRH